MRSFTLNTQFNSVTNLGIRVLEPPALPTTTQIIDQIEVAGRAGTLTRAVGWVDQTITIRCAITNTPDGTVLESFRSLRALCAGSVPGVGPITRLDLSTNPGVYYKVKHTAFTELTRLASSWWEFTITFTCEPFSYQAGVRPITLTESGQVVNPTMVLAEPVITVYGTGTLTLTIASTRHTVHSPAGQVTIDTPRKLCHVAGKIQTDALTGPFPIFAPLHNEVTLGAGVSKVVIEPGWRNL